MKQKLIVKYISIIFIIATFIGTLHHHNDMQDHNDCQICTIQNTLATADTPSDVNYLTLFCISSKATLVTPENFQIQELHFTFSARAPPFTS